MSFDKVKTLFLPLTKAGQEETIYLSPVPFCLSSPQSSQRDSLFFRKIVEKDDFPAHATLAGPGSPPDRVRGRLGDDWFLIAVRSTAMKKTLRLCELCER
jgi:hypothetical protein